MVGGFAADFCSMVSITVMEMCHMYMRWLVVDDCANEGDIECAAAIEQKNRKRDTIE